MIGENSGTRTGYLMGKFWGKFPGFPQKLGWGGGRHFWGISGTNWRWGQTRDRGIFGENSPKFPKNRGGDGEDIFGEYWGPIGDGDKLVTGEFWGIFPENSPISSLSPSPIGPRYSPKMSSPSPPQFFGKTGEFSPKFPR